MLSPRICWSPSSQGSLRVVTVAGCKALVELRVAGAAAELVVASGAVELQVRLSVA